MLTTNTIYKLIKKKKKPVRERLCKIFDYINQLSQGEHNSQNSSKKEGGWVAVNVDALSKIMNCESTSVYDALKFLKNAGQIESDGKYQKDKKVYWYRPTIEAKNDEKIQIELDEKTNYINIKSRDEKRVIKNVEVLKIDDLGAGAIEMIKKHIERENLDIFRTEKKVFAQKCPIKGHNKQALEEGEIEKKGKEELTRNIKPSMFRVSPPSVSSFVASTLSWVEPSIASLLPLLPPSDKKNRCLKKTTEQINHSNLSRLFYLLNSFYNFYCGYYSASRSSNNGRIRHNVVEMPKILRPFLFHPNYNLVDVDLANSQPSIIVGTMKKQGIEVEQSLIDAVSNGEFYKSIKKEANLSLSDDELKVECLRFFYTQASTNSKESEKDGVAKAFKSLWPIAFNWITNRKEELNLSHKKDSRQKKGSSLFAIEMQKAESDWMIGKVLRRLEIVI